MYSKKMFKNKWCSGERTARKWGRVVRRWQKNCEVVGKITMTMWERDVLGRKSPFSEEVL